MYAKDRILAVYDEDERENLDKVPSHVQYVDPAFISRYQEFFEGKYNTDVFNQYFGAPYVLGFDAVFAPFPSSFEFRNVKITDDQGNSVKIALDGQAVKRKTGYYEGGYVNSTDILNEMQKNLKEVDKTREIKNVLKKYEKIEKYIYPILMTNGIFDRVWQAMGMVEFSKHFKKKSNLYKGLIEFYANITEVEIKKLIKASNKTNRVINILDDVAFRGRVMISPKRWESDFLPYYKKINQIIINAGMVPQVHTDGDPTELIPYFQKAGFMGLQGWEGGADPFLISEKFPNFVVIGFGDVSHILPHGTKSQIKVHVQELMNALKDNKHFIIGPSTIIYEKIPLNNVIKFMEAVRLYGKYI
ncbi:MAG: hypothetical protein EU547_05485 [Promethearchaeota archaeon]|nr:MAG: hypothetical protein EU547_05485 [Candidatus Lokiarchaeota archaeon]